VMSLCREIGLQIPADLSLIGFDDTAFSAHVVPPLTTVRVDKEGMGRLALRRLVARIKDEGPVVSADPPVCNQLPVSLIIRDSCRSVV
jgi:DNA-binding LacI/PurR family transcriptional regulator